MNTTPRGPALERALLAKLEEILGEIDWLTELPSPELSPAGGPDAVIRLTSDSGPPLELRVHIKSEMRPSGFPAWASARRARAPDRNATRVLALPFVSARMAELCQQDRWSWLDLGGNCWLDIPGRLHIERTGKPAVHRRRRPQANLSSPAAARVMLVLLSPAHAGRTWTQRDLRDFTCLQRPRDRPVSLGLVNKVLRHLRDEEYVASADSGGTRVKDPLALLEAWSKAYRFDRHQRLSYFTLLKRPKLEEALYMLDLDSGGMAAYAAFSAAERQAPYVRQPRTWLYVASKFLDSMVEHTQAKAVDSGENLVVLIPEDSGVFLCFDGDRHAGEQSLRCTDPVQTYVDLTHCGGRGEEAAQALLEERILPRWREAGLA